MADREAPYDPYIPSGQSAGGSAAQHGENPRTAALKAQIDDTVGVMRDNINRVTERGDKINKMQQDTERLKESSSAFKRGANRVRKDMWWKDMKMRICIIVGIILLLLVIIVPTAVHFSKSGGA